MRPCFFLLVLAGCTPQLPSESDDPIIGGEDSDPSQNSVVRLTLRTDGGIYQCSGTLIAPNLVLTARHCVSQTADGNVGCSMYGVGDSGGQVFGDYEPSALSISVGNSRMRGGRDGGGMGMGGGMVDAGVRIHGLQILHDDGTNLCNHDLALILLDSQVPNALISPLRLDGPPVEGESLTAVGWGVSDKSDSPPIRQQRTGVLIQAVGPSKLHGGVPSNEFMVGEAPCEGDSGGPALDGQTLAIVGVVSRGGNGLGSDPNDPAAGCTGAGEENLYSEVAPYKALILDAFAQAGAQPWLEGSSNPIGAVFGSSCQYGGQCASGLCYGAGDMNGYCTADCSAQPCPAGYSCLQGDTTMVCGPPLKPSPTPKSASGCSTTPGPSHSSWIFLALALAFFALRRRRSA